MNLRPLYDVLEATGYLVDGARAPNVTIGPDARHNRHSRNFEPDARWQRPRRQPSRSSLTVYFKCEPSSPSEDTVAQWRQEIWNEGTAPLLWVISPDKVDIYNGFAEPRESGDAETHRIKTFKRTASDLEELGRAAGHLAMETDSFWQHRLARQINRQTTVDRLLLRDIACLENDLSNSGMKKLDAQGLIGRTIFAQYLVDREIVTQNFLVNLGDPKLSKILRNGAMAGRLFDWLRKVFNGNMFIDSGEVAEPAHLNRVADFLDGLDPNRQGTLFPYQFDIIPVELISSIYEQFVRSETATSPSTGHKDVHYTRLSLVSMVLDKAMSECNGDEKVLDLTCGSGVFLVEALRRLVHKRAGDQKPTRELIRETLYSQVWGSDISKAAIQVAAFSLYLTALELDPEPDPPDDLAFEPLIGRTLVQDDIWEEESQLSRLTNGRKFDVIVGNPPWSYPGKEFSERRKRTGAGGSRGTSLDFVVRAMHYASDSTRFGLVLGALQFFGQTPKTRQTLQDIMKKLASVTLVNLSNLTGWLFPNAKMPGMVLLARHRRDAPPAVTTIQVPWSPWGEKSHTFNIAASDITTLPMRDWERNPRFLKGAFLGTHRDLTLLDNLWRFNHKLKDQLGEIGTEFRTGLTIGNRNRDAGAMQGLRWLPGSIPMDPFSLPFDLVPFDHDRAQRPRKQRIYRAPVLIVREILLKQHARPLVAVAEQDVVYSDAYFGAVFSPKDDLPHLLAGILSSSLATWFLLMTGSALGLWKKRIKSTDVNQMPVPDLREATASEIGRSITDLARSLRGRAATQHDWTTLDEAVFEVYRLRPWERSVVQDGLFQATWQWVPGRNESVAPASTEHVMQYTKAFVSGVDVWLRTRNMRRLRAEVFDLAPTDPMRVVRFVLEDRPGPSVARVVAPDEDLASLLHQIGGRFGFSLADELVRRQEVRAHDAHEIVIVKPAARHHWMERYGLRDADDVVADSMRSPG